MTTTALRSHYTEFAAYNRWANQRLLTTAAALADEEYRRDMGAFFGSLHGSFNHLIVADRIWLHRFTGAGPTYRDLASQPCADFSAVKAAREAEDERIIGFIEGLSEVEIGQSFTFTTIVNPAEITQRRAGALAHFFNHQTHHRGQMHATITALGHPAPSLDMIVFQRER